MGPKIRRKVLLYTFAAAGILYIVFLWGCAYVGPSILPSYIKKIKIDTFINKSFRPDMDEKITTAVTEEFIVDGRLIPSSKDKADAILFGEIKRYALEPLSYTEKMNVEEYKVHIVIDIWLKDLRQNEILWREDNIETWTTTFSTGGGLEVKVENEVINEVVDNLAKKVVKRVIDGWK